MKKEELLSYVAGYIDGDGCISAFQVGGDSSPRFRCIVEISSKVRHSVEYIQGLLSNGKITPESDGTFRARYWYQEAARVSSIVQPYLYLKRPQALLIVGLHSLIKGWTRQHKVTEAVFAQRRAIAVQIQSLNQNPRPLDSDKPKSKRRSFAYLAGIIDAEGCVRIERKGRELSPVVHVRMKDGYVCKWIAERFGGYILDPSPSNNVYTWGAERHVAVSCLRKIKPYLRLKQEQAEIAIRLQRHKDLWQSKMRGRRLPDSVIKKRFEWKDRLAVLNIC